MEQYGVQRVKVILEKIVGGGRAIYEYLEKKQDARVAKSIGYVRRFSTEPLIVAQTRIGKAGAGDDAGLVV
jgi:hypothetical protein